MDKNLNHIADFIKASQHIPEGEKQALLKALKGVDKELKILDFKLERTEKVKRTTSILLEETIAELEQKRKAVEEALSELKATQKQLIHAEKMASLGELTAGIAHEIQNPLNFVNNFSEVSGELIDEMQEEIDNGAWEEVKALGADLKENLSKINHHGRRADGIVKGMLQHSRSSEGEKELTDLNTLVDEYQRLAYHGMRAKNKTFNTSMLVDLDPNAGLVEMVPQEIGRVLLNLLTNAFHAVIEKKEEGSKEYKPGVTVQTRKAGKGIEIRVTDNGNGIPEKVRDKIFQPFFTTKPTGQGTGLGLSLSYDIIKAHGGTLEVKSEEGKGTEFITKLPVA
ncbi:sensor histidine kinase [Robiginitalea aurantiaca]|uniref:histidine kinase n=1 Tax=Robiginitalea aurantiaca TaxID=3056915 RepID=A0ABT7WDF7_9FLAO|nr:ATP-binding protein [Robiginitalea aurantiaca]MDM9630943.1 ATP-binding protein [Robiginitalea aurantiaca]